MVCDTESIPGSYSSAIYSYCYSMARQGRGRAEKSSSDLGLTYLIRHQGYS